MKYSFQSMCERCLVFQAVTMQSTSWSFTRTEGWTVCFFSSIQCHCLILVSAQTSLREEDYYLTGSFLNTSDIFLLNTPTCCYQSPARYVSEPYDWVTSAFVLAALTFLPAPVNLSVKSVNFHHVLRWDPGPGTPPGAEYRIYRIKG